MTVIDGQVWIHEIDSWVSTKDYKEYQDAGFKGSQIEFAFQKFMEINLNTPEFGELKYTGGYRAFDDKVIANKKAKQTKAVVGDNKKFDQKLQYSLKYYKLN